MAKNKNEVLLELKDIKLKSETVSTSEEYVFNNNLPQNSELLFLSTGVQCRGYDGTGENEGLAVYVFRHKFGVKLLSEDESKPEVAKIECEYDAIYVQKNKDKIPSEEYLVNFSKNAEYNLWSFWREHSNSTFLKMGIPNVLLPLAPPLKSQKG